MITPNCWLPITYVPKDGTTVDLWCVNERGEGHRVVNASWNFHYWLHGQPTRPKSWGHDSMDGPFLWGEPTHFMLVTGPENLGPHS